MMDIKQNTKKYLILTFIVMSLFIFFKIDFRLKEIIPGAISDDSAYYYHSQTIGVDLDLDYSNQLEGTNKRNPRQRLGQLFFLNFTFLGTHPTKPKSRILGRRSQEIRCTASMVRSTSRST